MIYVVDGPDGYGKTPFLLKLLGLGMYKAYRHGTYGATNSETLMETYHKFVGEDALFDRWWPAEFAYSDIGYNGRLAEVCYKLAVVQDVAYEIWVREDDTSELAQRYRAVAHQFRLPVTEPKFIRKESIDSKDEEPVANVSSTLTADYKDYIKAVSAQDKYSITSWGTVQQVLPSMLSPDLSPTASEQNFKAERAGLKDLTDLAPPMDVRARYERSTQAERDAFDISHAQNPSAKFDN